MNTLKTDVGVNADGSLKLLSPLLEWLKPGRACVLLSVEKRVFEVLPQSLK